MLKGFVLPMVLFVVVLLIAGAFLWFRIKPSLLLRNKNIVFPTNTPGQENLSKLMQGCPGKDCIPSIDKPKFESVSEADRWLKPDDVIFSLNYKGESRAYPQRILNWHEIVNDVAAGDPMAITFCPLCGSALAFNRRVDEQILEFGVSGKLKNNDLVMYDRQTDTLWQQITGEAIVGNLLGKKLKQISLDGMRWEQFGQENPHGKVLSRDTGFSRDYNTYPYGSYEQDRETLFPVEGGVDETIHPKSVVYGIEVAGSFKAYPEDRIKKTASLRGQKVKDLVANVEVEIAYKNGDVTVKRLDTEEEIVPVRLFWFAWKAFHPETELY